MSLSDELDELTQSVKGCHTCAWYAEQPEHVRAKFDAALDRGVRKSDLHAVATRHGLDISKRQFSEHCATHVDR